MKIHGFKSAHWLKAGAFAAVAFLNPVLSHSQTILQYNSLSAAQKAQLDSAVMLYKSRQAPAQFGSTFVSPFDPAKTVHSILMSSDTNTPTPDFKNQVSIVKSFDASLMCMDKALIKKEVMRNYSTCGLWSGPTGSSYVPLQTGTLSISTRPASNFWQGNASGSFPASYTNNFVAGYCPDIKDDLSNLKYLVWHDDNTTWGTCRLYFMPPNFSQSIFASTATYDPIQTKFQLCQQTGRTPGSVENCGANSTHESSFGATCPAGYGFGYDSSGKLVCNLSCPAQAAAGQSVRGDLNCDGNLSGLDIVLLQRHLNSITPANPNPANPKCSNGKVIDSSVLDVNGDGKLNQSDIDALRNSILGRCK